IGTALAFVAGSATSCAAWTARVPRPRRRGGEDSVSARVSVRGSVVVLMIRRSFIDRGTKKPGPLAGEGRAGVPGPGSVSSYVRSTSAVPPVRLSRRESRHAHHHAHHEDGTAELGTHGLEKPPEKSFARTVAAGRAL